ncbi:hypothetical protein [Streptodolium elevatio]|uniref:Uncharacterized protein n=1 Tax=Streptodolium elevatio TaxID=3157996 RepID=A0ABV3DAA2_9ACTN
MDGENARDAWRRRAAAAYFGARVRGPGGAGVRGTEAVLVRHYAELTRTAYLILPPSDGRHGRVLAAHGIVQDALPGRGAEPLDEDGLRARVVRGALRYAGRRRRRLLPRVWGLRFFTVTADPDALAVEREVAALTPLGRAAYALLFPAGLTADHVASVLADAGAADPEGAVAEAVRAGASAPGSRRPVRELVDAGPLDPCTVRVSASDLLRRRRRRHTAAGAAVTALAVTLSLVVLVDGDPRPDRAPVGAPVAPVAASVPPVRVAPDAWASTTRLDFAVWSTRGPLAGDAALADRAVRAWQTPDPGLTPHAEVRTTPGPPVGTPRILFAGDVGGERVVLLADPTRLARYTEAGQVRTLAVGAADDSDARSASAVVLTRGADGVRLLLAPWVTGAQVRDLRSPGVSPRPLTVDQDGVTGPALLDVADCARVGVLELRATRAADGNPYLVADLGGLAATHLTYMPPPEFTHTGRPSEAASSERALNAWSLTACMLADLRGHGLRLVNNWEFAHFALPEAPTGEATWSCLHGFDRVGGGTVNVAFTPPGADAAATRTVGAVRDAPLCSRSGNDVVGFTWWQSGTGAWFLVAAGSRDIVGVTAAGPVTGTAEGRQLVVPVPATAPQGPLPQVVGRTKTGTDVPAPTAPE